MQRNTHLSYCMLFVTDDCLNPRKDKYWSHDKARLVMDWHATRAEGWYDICYSSWCSQTRKTGVWNVRCVGQRFLWGRSASKFWFPIPGLMTGLSNHLWCIKCRDSEVIIIIQAANTHQSISGHNDKRTAIVYDNNIVGRGYYTNKMPLHKYLSSTLLLRQQH